MVLKLLEQILYFLLVFCDFLLVVVYLGEKRVYFFLFFVVFCCFLLELVFEFCDFLGVFFGNLGEFDRSLRGLGVGLPYLGVRLVRVGLYGRL